MADTKNVFISHIHEDDVKLRLLTALHCIAASSSHFYLVAALAKDCFDDLLEGSRVLRH